MDDFHSVFSHCVLTVDTWGPWETRGFWNCRGGGPGEHAHAQSWGVAPWEHEQCHHRRPPRPQCLMTHVPLSASGVALDTVPTAQPWIHLYLKFSGSCFKAL